MNVPSSSSNSTTFQPNGISHRGDDGMIFKIGDIPVYFPYAFIYPEQYEYMQEIYRALSAKQHCMLEMPTGTGKTVALLSFITSYQFARKNQSAKLIYCTRTVSEMDKTLEELKELIEFRKRKLGNVEGADIFAVGLSSRKNLCIHPVVSEETERQKTDEKCRQITASWVRKKHEEDTTVPICNFYLGFEKEATEEVMPKGVYTLEDIKNYGQRKGYCPYFLSRYSIRYADVIVYNYAYLLDPKISNLVSKEMEKDCIVVFDEAHNIDNVCIESLSVEIGRETLTAATRNLASLRTAVDNVKIKNNQKLQEEYHRLVQGLRESGAISDARAVETDAVRGAPIANPPMEMGDLIPGEIRKAELFINFMRRVVEHLKTRLKPTAIMEETLPEFLKKMIAHIGCDARSLKFAFERLKSLMNTLEIADVESFRHLSSVADFSTLVATFKTGFAIIIGEKNIEIDGRPTFEKEPKIHLACLDASLCMQPIFDRFNTVVITSGTLSPIDFYPKILNFRPLTKSLEMTMSRECIIPMIVTRGSDQMPLTSSYKHRDDRSVLRNYGLLVAELCRVVPDGIVVFFTSYLYMETVITSWHEGQILDLITKYKLLFMETKDVMETSVALHNYKRACDCGRGAVFFSVARGKVSEGIDFDRHYGRCVVLLGVPYQYTESYVLKCRLKYMQTNYQIPESEFLTFDAIRQASQCVGRVIRSKNDYGVMIFADQRFKKNDKRLKLPGWILKCMSEENIDLSVELAVEKTKTFLRKMAQPQVRSAQLGTVLLSQADLEARHPAT